MKNYQVFKTVLHQKSIDNVNEVLKSGWIGLGPKSAEFETKFAEYVGSKYCIGLNSATSALHLALKVIGVGPGDEVISTPITFVSTNHAILYCGATPVFADVLVNGNLDPDSVESKITKNTKAIMVVHYSGCPANLDRFYEISRQYNIPVIEDCAHACGAEYRGRKIGGTGLIHCFSFHAVKNLPMGDGGAITTNNPIYAQKLKELRWLGINKTTYDRTSVPHATAPSYLWDYNVDEIGYKYHINDIAAAIGLGELEYIDESNEHRGKIAKIYQEQLNILDITVPVPEQHIKSSYHFQPILINNRDEVVAKLKEKGISPGVHYKRNDMFPMYPKTELPGAESFWKRELTLPIHLEITTEDAMYIAQTLKELI